MTTDETEGRWIRARRAPGGRRWVRIALVALLVPLLLAAAVASIAGRPLAFAVVQRLTVRKFPDVRWIDRGELARWREDATRPQPLVLDARTRAEYEVSHLRDAVFIDPGRPSLRPLAKRPKDDPIVVYCSVGYRAARLAHWLAGQGYSNVRNLSGSFFQWANEDRPIFRDGRPTTEVHPYDRRWGLMLDRRYRAAVPDVETPFAAP